MNRRRFIRTSLSGCASLAAASAAPEVRALVTFHNGSAFELSRVSLCSSTGIDIVPPKEPDLKKMEYVTSSEGSSESGFNIQVVIDGAWVFVDWKALRAFHQVYLPESQTTWKLGIKVRTDRGSLLWDAPIPFNPSAGLDVIGNESVLGTSPTPKRIHLDQVHSFEGDSSSCRLGTRDGTFNLVQTRLASTNYPYDASPAVSRIKMTTQEGFGRSYDIPTVEIKKFSLEVSSSTERWMFWGHSGSPLTVDGVNFKSIRGITSDNRVIHASFTGRSGPAAVVTSVEFKS